ncbi:LRR receptor-like serine threonine- kinase GSO1 [Olea europaea subsp. europaea]|uniref:LRR receptor-like serine threonine- kinase GSO1 n=1 Tax=Olea europaea subsp. europaea TaxID=158383 RepID=A0A8S0U7D9_OLEEU|nr:LRR receptor-like serine threonine- kinase GSO1 [Olea europaea subsp. europaea]
MGNMTRLEQVSISNNQLEGPIPVEICNLDSLFLLNLSENKLCCSLPSCFNPSSISHVYLNNNQLEGSILNHMSGIDFSSNKLHGEISDDLGKLSKIHSLNLSHNNLVGTIPETFSNLHQIESLDLSYNSLSGRIPTGLIELNALEVFSVAHKNLTRRILEKGQFGTFDEGSY